jgi:hypothetical protein
VTPPFGAFWPQYSFYEATGLPSTGAAGLTETGEGGHLIGTRLGVTVLAGAGLLTDVDVLAMASCSPLVRDAFSTP